MSSNFILSLSLIFIFHVGAFAVEVKPACEVRSLYEANKSLLPQQQQVIQSSTGSFINPYYQEPVASRSREVQMPGAVRAQALRNAPNVRTADDIRRMISDLKKSFSDLISAGADEKSLNEEQKIMLRRLDQTRFVISDCQGVEGSREKTTGIVTLCGNSLKMPRLALATLISHEIGHGLDLCALARSQDRLPTLSFDRNPVRPTYNCLRQNLPTSYRLPATIDAACDETHYTETSAQIWGAAALGNYIEKQPIANPTEALGLFANFAVGSKGPSPKEIDMNEIYLSVPSLQRAIGCQARLTQNCMSYFRAQGYGSVGSSSSTRPAATRTPTK